MITGIWMNEEHGANQLDGHPASGWVEMQPGEGR